MSMYWNVRSKAQCLPEVKNGANVDAQTNTRSDDRLVCASIPNIRLCT